MSESSINQPDWIRDANHPSCTCFSGHCIFHSYPYSGPIVEYTRELVQSRKMEKS